MTNKVQFWQTYFIEEKGYEPIKRQDGLMEYWLVNQHNMQYPHIRISTNSLKQDEMLEAACQAAEENRMHTEGKLLNIYFGEEQYVAEQEAVTTVILASQVQVTSLPTIFWAVDAFQEKQKRNKTTGFFGSSRRWKTNRDMPYVTFGIIAVCVVIFLLAQLMIQIFDNKVNVSIVLGGYYRIFVVANHEYWRFLTAGLLHTDLMHLFCNMFSLYSLGISLEKVLGHSRFALVFFGSLLVSTCVVHVIPGSYLVLGASGGIFGLFGAWIVYAIYTKAIRNPQVMKSLIMIIGLNVLINLMPNISVIGHLGGLAAGLLLGVIVMPGTKWRTFQMNMVLAMSLCLCVLSYQAVRTNGVVNFYIKTDMDALSIYHRLGFKNYAAKANEGLESFYERKYIP